MPRQRPNTPAAPRPRRARNGEQPPRRERRRDSGGDELELTDEELRALADENIDPEEVIRLAREDDEQEASEHDRDTARDRIEGLLLEQEEDY
ncbi:MAG TPA: hypothetical protein VK891_18060 [Euzebyales bacterium]|nr:hypothetical protein [Euzebyales bacterium]